MDGTHRTKKRAAAILLGFFAAAAIAMPSAQAADRTVSELIPVGQTVGVKQFDVEHTAQRGRSEGGGSHDVCLIVNGVVLHVGGIVEMDIDRLAGIASVKTRSGFETTEQTVRSGELRKGNVSGNA